MVKRLISTIICFMILLTLFVSAGTYTQATSSLSKNRQAVVIFVEGLSFADLERFSAYPHVDNLFKKGTIGAMTIRTAGARTPENAYLLMGSGGQALYTRQSGTVYEADEVLETGETALERMRQLGGASFAAHVPTPTGTAVGTSEIHLSTNTYPDRADTNPALLFPGIYRLQAENLDQPFTARIGLLGSVLEQHGMQVRFYGNSDGMGVKERNGALFAVNANGTIAEGAVSSGKLTVHDPDYPHGLRTNYTFLLDQLQQNQKPGLTVIQLSDLLRLYRMQNQMHPDQFAKQYDRILRDLDQFLGNLLSTRTSQQMVMLLSPDVNPVAQKQKSLLTPAVIWSGGAGLAAEASLRELASATTRQPGIVSGLDVLPTILSWCGVPVPEGIVGHAMEVGKVSTIESFLAKIKRIDYIYGNRSIIMYSYVMLQIAVLIVAAFFWVWKKAGRYPVAYRLRRGVRLALLAMLFFPALFLIEPLLLWTVPPAVVFVVMMLFALGGALIVERWPLPQLLFTVAAFTVVSILIDGFTGATAMRRSYMGYDPVIGARFYGLGNEYEGVLIGASILLVASFYEWWSRKNGRNQKQVSSLHFWLSITAFVIVLFYMCAPTLGTNAGGFLAGAVGFGIALFRLQGWRVGTKGFLLLAGGVCAGIGVLIVMNLSSTGPLTHVGRVANDIVTGNWAEVIHIVERKLEMNVRLIRVSSWSKVFVLSLVIISLLSLRPDRYLRHLARQYPFLVKGFSGVIAGSLAGLILNDSGIVSAATSIVFFVVPALYAALSDVDEEKGEAHTPTPDEPQAT
ncbi:hypothetical protein [Brevibacillus dissolubilis]|uniref:hypothetical protein n=1 Tax=Brevibacillus dissolubilis TaxID=1844116 RepID=UPI001115F0A1|nr:hypothetical protein [Brevibacillus dissolubilis]